MRNWFAVSFRIKVSNGGSPGLPGLAAHSVALDLDAETSDCADVAVPKPVAPTTREPEIPGHQHVASKRELLEIMSNDIQ